MPQLPQAPRHAVSFWTPTKDDTRRRARESRRNQLRGKAATWVIVVIAVAVLAVLGWIWHLTRPTNLLSWAALGAPAFVVGLLIASAMRPFRRPPPPLKSERNHLCELSNAGVRISCPVDEVRLNWSAVAIIPEPNWVAIEHPMGTMPLPREAFDEGADRVFEEFASERAGSDATSSLLIDPPDSAVAFTIAPDAICGNRRQHIVVASLIALMNIVAMAGLLVMYSFVMGISAFAWCAAGGGAVLGTLLGVRDMRRNHARLRSAWGSPRRVWLTEQALVTQSSGWEHRIARDAIDGIEHQRGLIFIRAKETGCMLDGTAANSAPAIREFISSVESHTTE